MRPRSDLLAPPPRRCRTGDGPVRPATSVEATKVRPELAGVPPIAALLAELRGSASPQSPTDASSGRFPLRLRENPAAGLPAQGYRLRIDGGGAIEIVAPDRAGLLHGSATLRQWLRLHPRSPGGAPEALWPIDVEDWPDFRERGVMLDVSRNKVPSLATLKRLVDLLSSLKINQLQLYTEHTFAYAGHEEVWRGASPLTPHDVRALDAWCADRGVELVPNQNSFGHLHRWLVHHPYRRLAECPEGIVHPWSEGRREPFSLCPIDPDSLRLLEDLYDQLLPCFRSNLLNVGLDETFDLGLGRSRQACEARGRGRVYLDFLRAIHARVSGWGRRVMFWGDIALGHPELLPEVPPDAIALVWGYEADHPFPAQCEALAASGLEFYVCPGTSSWLSLAGRLTNAVANLAAAARAGVEHGARGFLVTDWGDRGHLQPLPISYPPLVAGACFAWNAEAARAPETLPIAELLDTWAVPGLDSGTTLVALGDLHLVTGRALANSTVPFHLLVGAADPLTRRGLDRLDAAALAAASSEAAALLAALPAARAGDAEGELVRRELAWAGEAVRLGCDLGRARLERGAIEDARALPETVRHALANRLDELTVSRRELWLTRNRPGGLESSLGYLKAVRELLITA
ncbi:MAG TPA: family 20 glycosylhydrolase [Thermoanaerobaculia bacterium]|nr:family 20 glycosylhydrolase [Thermoanaerobaculia bacterium]